MLEAKFWNLDIEKKKSKSQSKNSTVNFDLNDLKNGCKTFHLWTFQHQFSTPNFSAVNFSTVNFPTPEFLTMNFSNQTSFQPLSFQP